MILPGWRTCWKSCQPAWAPRPPRWPANTRSYGRLKLPVVEALIALLDPIRVRPAELDRDPGYVQQLLADGAQRARERAAGTVHRAKQAIGQLG